MAVAKVITATGHQRVIKLKNKQTAWQSNAGRVIAEPSVSAGTWTENIATPTKDVVAMCTIGTDIYYIDNRDATVNVKQTIYKYDTITKTDTLISTRPYNNFYWTDIATDGTNIYCGGDDSSIYIYNISGDSWSASAGGAPSVILDMTYLDGNVYMFSFGASVFYIYNISGDSWSTSASRSGGSVEGQDHTTDGIDLFIVNLSGELYKYDVSANTWSNIANLKVQLGLGALAPKWIAYYNGVFYLKQGSSITTMIKYVVSEDASYLSTAPSVDWEIRTMVGQFYYTKELASTYDFMTYDTIGGSATWQRIL